MSSYPLAPHISLPFRVSSGRVAVTEQDSIEEVFDCVSAIIRCPLGARTDKPEFGVPDVTFSQRPIPTAGIKAAVQDWEPRAGTTLEEKAPGFDKLVDEIVVRVSTEGGTSG